MNLKTTLVLAACVVAGGVAYVTWLLVGFFHPVPPNETLEVLEHKLTLAAVTRIEVRRGDHHVKLEKKGQDWSLPGQWPIRQPEVEQLVRTITGLRTRFTPVPLGNPPALEDFGLDGQPLVVTVRAGDKDYKLAFGEKADKENRFSSPTFLRLGDQPHVVRLAPGLAAALDRPEDYYMQRRLFPAQRVATADEEGKKVEQVAARSLEFKGGAIAYTLAHDKDAWELRQPVHDRLDPDKLKAILSAVPDIWAEDFKPGMDLEASGLKQPEQTLVITRPSGERITLLVGKQSEMKVRKVQKPGMPDGSPLGPQPRMEFVHDEYRFAKLQDNERIFQVKADRLKELAVATDVLRDPQVARFKSNDVTRIVVNEGGRELIFSKDKERWKLEKPMSVAAETSKVTELLERLSGLQARDKEVIDKTDPKKYGLDKPATIKLTVKASSPKEIAFAIGTAGGDADKIYVQVAGWPRVNAANADLLKLVKQPALAYRSRRVLDFASSDLARVEVQPGKGEVFMLAQEKGKWRLASPVSADIESFKAEQLAGDLSRLEATEFVSAEPKKDELEKVYGLEKPALTVKAAFTDAKKPAQTLLIGNKRPGKDDYFARLASDPAVFVISKEVQTTLAKDSLAYRALELWQMQPEDVAEVRVQKNGPEYRLDRAGENWKISGPFEAAAVADQVTLLVKELAGLKAERFTANTARDLREYGLDKPYLRVTLKPVAKKEAAARDDKRENGHERVLLIGKSAPSPQPLSAAPGERGRGEGAGPAGKEGQGRFARLADGEAIFVVADKVVASVDHDALDLLDRKLLSLDPAVIRRIQTAAGDAKFTLTKEKEWRVTDSPASPFGPDKEAIDEVLRVWSNLQASKYAAYSDKIDAAKFGLDKAAATVTVTEQPPAEKQKAGKATEHTLVMGKLVEGGKGERYARVDKGPGVAVLDADTVKVISRTYLDYVNHKVFAFDARRVAGIQRRGETDTLELAKNGEKWQLIKPADLPADGPTVDQLVGELASLRAVKVAAYPARDVRVQGLDKPAAVVTIRMMDDKGKPMEHVLQIGKLADHEPGSRYARADNSETVVIVPGKLAKQLLAGLLQFRDRNIARVAAPDKAIVERGARKTTFSLNDGTWKMTEPLAAEAETNDLQGFLSSLSTLRADELVADKPGDLKPYGLDRPQVRWRLLQGDKELLTLLVGGFEKAADGKHQAYARLGTAPLVFLLDTRATDQALGEYRSRKVWGAAAPDAAQVDKLEYGYARNPFVLQKVDNKWQVAGGKPMSQLNEDVVRDALDALAGLQAERYVADKAEDLKLYGLEPPVLALSVETTSGKRTLHVGRKEGGSERYYALVPGPDGAVFLLSEADARRIVRPLDAFLKR